jgi:hypothetical protein
MKNHPTLSRSFGKIAVALGLGCAALTFAAPQRASAQPLSLHSMFDDLGEVVRIGLAEGLDLFGAPDAEAMAIGKPTFLADEWYRVTDEFEEACGLGSLRIETANHVYTTIERGKAKYVHPYADPNDAFGGRFDWKCGTNLEHSECSDSPGGADWIRVYWESNTRNIQIKCFEKCGDGSSEADCK